MPEGQAYDAKIVPPSASVQQQERVFTRDKNLTGIQFTDLSQHPYANRKPDYWVHVYNISHREFHVTRPPHCPNIRIPACPDDEPYILAIKFPNITHLKDIRAESGETDLIPQYGERMAMDIINPSNLGVDMWAQPPADQAWLDGGSDDLSRRGVFWTINNPPTREELTKAKQRMEQHYHALIERANQISQDPQAPKNEISPEMHKAADYFQISPGWHSHLATPEFCENCGEQIRPGVAFHMNQSIGMLCIRSWEKAVNAGVKKLEDVPASHRGDWWRAAREVEEMGELEAKTRPSKAKQQ